MQKRFNLKSSELSVPGRIISIAGTEQISEPYSFQISFVQENVESLVFELEEAVGRACTLELLDDQGAMQGHYHGLLSDVELVHDLPSSALYIATLVPRLWRLQLGSGSRTFVDSSLPDVLNEILRAAGFKEGTDYELRLSGKYEPLAHVTQFRESPLAFITRRMARDGVYFFFEQGEDHEKLIITDNKQHHERTSHDYIDYMPLMGADTSGVQAFTSFRCQRRVLPGQVTLRDDDYLHPTMEVAGEASVSPSAEVQTVYGDGLVDPDGGTRQARVRAEELKATETVYRGRGRVHGLAPGAVFELDDHPKPSINGEYLITSITHHGSDLGGLSEFADVLGSSGASEEPDYNIALTCIPATVQYRPPRQDPPKMYGLERAVIDGEEDSEYAQLDEHGRYLVRFRFDESELGPGRASARIRMMQPHAGDPEGFHFPLRKGTEVLVAFVGGDPDQPVITGALPDARHPSPVASDNATRNVLQTGGQTRIEIEDAAGGQHLTISTPPQKTRLHLGAAVKPDEHNVVVRTDGNALHQTGTDNDITVGGKQTEKVTGNVDETFEANHTSTVFGNREEITQKTLRQLVKGDAQQTIEGSLKQQILQGEDRYVSGGSVEEINGDRVHTVQGGSSHEAQAFIQHRSPGAVYVEGGAASVELNAGACTIKAPVGYQLIAPKAEQIDADCISIAGHKAEIVGASESMKGSKLEIVAQATAILENSVKICAMDVSVSKTKFSNTPHKIENVSTAIAQGYTNIHTFGLVIIP